MRSPSRSTKALGTLAILLAAAAGACDVTTDAGLYVPDAGDGGPATDATVVDGNPGTDATDTDAGADAPADVRPLDTGVVEAGKDSGVDTGTDAGSDAGAEAGSDAGADAEADAGADAGTDAGADAGTDAGADAGTDAGADADTDASDAADGDGGPICKTSFTVTARDSGSYQIDGQNNPTLDVCKGDTVTFTMNAPGHPLWIKTLSTAGTGGAYNDGVTGNGTATGTITWVVGATAPALLYYNCEFHGAMTGPINVH